MKGSIKIPISRYVFALVISALYAMCIWLFCGDIFKASGSAMLSILGFLSVVIVFILILFTKKIVFLGEMNKSDIEYALEDKKSDIGPFAYSELGFSYNDSLFIKWENINKIVLVKEDNFDVDRISIIIQEVSNSFELSEDDAGWFIFLDKLSMALHLKDFRSLLLIAYSKGGNSIIWERES